ncbi:unnamed protein product [Lathyrus oleraceus]|uniref:Uncharacterized protein n=1 Tax=Pisum sativum TaxID=3888 RepID=A0A9D4XWA0_PEA|nr:hypothetical protein KIW84_032636 [Pisum sativum]
MTKFNQIISSLLINVALLVLFTNNAKTNATRFHSTTLEVNGDFILPKKVDQFGRQSSIDFAHKVYYNTRERLGDHTRSHHHLFQYGNIGHILRQSPEGPSKRHNPTTIPNIPAAHVYS